MASASTSDGCSGRIRNAALALVSDNQSLIVEIRKAVNMMKNIAVDLERENQTDMVKDLENAAAELLDLFGDCAHHSSAIQSVANAYQPGDQVTDFKKLLENEFTKLKETASSVSQTDNLMRQFREAVWNVHHKEQPMPGDDQEDIVMTSTQCLLLNITCPLTGKPVVELADPVRSMECKHIYDKAAVMGYISRTGNARCPVAGCPKLLKKDKVICDPMLKFEIEEMRSAMNKESCRTEVIEDFTEFVDED
ncbi:PREDICTED: E3 SUMO-protein ligase MMS21 [Tarenaya hassleriana]|uniref:E3 SUMO-protein ligase MMS21 n=1 Tax=Tarenaya hassleriana TaxID=28532 RepID=UPI00053C6DDA|nr:PREDICTED: E3 SUMO-protein ligase MMS21 [Tarenaya hassleriana]